MSEKRFLELDVLRGLAALFVLFFHFTLFREESKYGFFLGITGVDLFFMISGFVILMSIEKSKNANYFLLFRCVRLYPIYWIIATFTFLLFLFLNLTESPVPYVEIQGKDYLGNLTMFQYYLGLPNIDGSYWTLIIEMLFYILMYLLLRLNLLKSIVFIGFVICIISCIWIFAIRNFQLNDQTSLFPLIYHFPLFYIGILFYKISRTSVIPFYYFLLISASILIQLYLFEYGRAFNFISIYSYGIILVSFCVLFFLIVRNKLGILVCKPTRFLGNISYPLYLIHQPLCYGIIIPFFTDVLHMNFWISTLLIALPISLVLASFFTFKIDGPLRIFLKKQIHKFILKEKSKKLI